MEGVRETLRGKHVLVTGVTGFLGKVWLAMLLEHVPEIGRVTVIVRANKKKGAEERFDEVAERSPAFRRLRARLGPGRFHDFIEEKVDVVAGDVSQRLAGLDERTLFQLEETLDAVVHFAGLTDFEPDPVLGIATNVRGCEGAADVASRARVPRLVHVSTAFVAGSVSGEIPEEIRVGISPSGVRFDPVEVLRGIEAALADVAERRERIDHVQAIATELGWPNGYTFTKAMAEHLVMRRRDVRTTIIRPTVVESAVAQPFAGWNEGINTSGPLVWLLSSWFRKFPSQPKHRFDVVPVDTVARGTMLVLAAHLRDEADAVYQLGSSDTNPLTFERAIDLTALGARRMHSSEEASPVARYFLKYLDAVPRDAARDPFPSLALLRKTAQVARDRLRAIAPADVLPPSLHARFGETLDQRMKSASMDFRNVDRMLSRVQEMLRVYQPFIHDNDYVFRTDRIRALSAALDDEERSLFGWNIQSLDWRAYWLDVHVPGLERWSLPLLRNERVPDDPPFPRPARAAARPRAASLAHREPQVAEKRA